MRGRDLKELKKNEVPPEVHAGLLHDLKDSGQRPLIYFWGGEPMLYAGVLDLVDLAASLKMPVSIATNGRGIARAAARLVAAPLFLLQISVDGPDADTHNHARPAAGKGNNFSEALDALEAVKRERRGTRSGLPLIASLTVINHGNYRRLTDIYRTLRDKVDLMVFYPSWWIDEAAAQAHDQDFHRRFGFHPTRHRGWLGIAKPGDLEALEQELEELKKLSSARNATPATLVPPLNGRDEIRTYYTDHADFLGYRQCVSIFQTPEINSNGDVSPCRDYHDFVVGNIKDAPLTELWNSFRYRLFRDSAAREGPMPVCSRCRGLMGY
ncbi:MAG: SPASM domain-containing protein [Pseudomonadota bacterium]